MTTTDASSGESAPPLDASASPGAVAGRGRLRGLVLLAASVLALNIGMNVHMSANVSYIDRELHASAWQQGYMESIRESCGIFSFLAIVALLGRSEPLVSAVMLVVAGCGLSGFLLARNIPEALAVSLVWSAGLHVWMPLASSMQLGLAKPGSEGRTLGAIRAAAAAGTLLGLGGVYLLRTHAGVGLRGLFLVAGAAIVLGAVPSALIPDIKLKKAARLPLRKVLEPGYRLYCGLEFLDGMRKQIFLLLATLVLVREKKVDVAHVATLMLLSQVILLAASPAAGWVIDSLGERFALTLYFGACAVIFPLYAVASDLRTLSAIYVADNVMFAFRSAVATYANRVARPGERTQLLAMGVTMNHIGAVLLPLAGGYLYSRVGYALPFYCGAGIALVSVVVSQFVDRSSSARQAGAPSP